MWLDAVALDVLPEKEGLSRTHALYHDSLSICGSLDETLRCAVANPANAGQIQCISQVHQQQSSLKPWSVGLGIGQYWEANVGHKCVSRFSTMSVWMQIYVSGSLHVTSICITSSLSHTYLSSMHVHIGSLLAGRPVVIQATSTFTNIQYALMQT